MDYFNKLVVMLRLYGVWIPALMVFAFLESGLNGIADLGVAESAAILALAGAVIGRIIEKIKIGD